MTPLCQFLAGIGCDNAGRKITDYLNFDTSQLEEVHDYIQWAFPTLTPSAYNPDARVLGWDDIESIHLHDSAQYYLERMTQKMIRFYQDYDGWLVESDHNHLRISRILESLNLLMVDESVAPRFYVAILERVTWNRSPIDAKALRIWQKKYEACDKYEAWDNQEVRPDIDNEFAVYK